MTETGLIEVPENFYFWIRPKVDKPEAVSMTLVRKESRMVSLGVQYQNPDGAARVETMGRVVESFRRKSILGIEYGEPVLPVWSDKVEQICHYHEEAWPHIEDLSPENLRVVSEELWRRYQSNKKYRAEQAEKRQKALDISGTYPPRKLGD